MGKICDPPPFTGGQMQGIRYAIQIRTVNNFTGAVLYWVQQHNNGGRGRATPFTDAEMIGSASGWYIARGKILGIDLSNPPYYEPWNLFTSNGTIVNFFNVLNNNKPSGIYRVVRMDGLVDTGGDLPSTNCRCTDDSCRVDCAGAPDGFCCIDHSVTNTLLQVIT